MAEDVLLILKVVVALEVVLVGVDLEVLRVVVARSKGVLGSMPKKVIWFHIGRLAWNGNRLILRSKLAACRTRRGCPIDRPSPWDADNETWA